MNKKILCTTILVLGVIFSFISRPVSIVVGVILILSSLFSLTSTTVYMVNPKFWDKVSDTKTPMFLPDIKVIAANSCTYEADSIIFLFIGILLFSGVHITFLRNTIIACRSIFVG